MQKIFSLLFFIVVSKSAHCADRFPVHSWWIQCNGNETNSTCLTETELSKFKTICSSKNFREDCRRVVDYVVAKTRLTEGKIFLSNFSAKNLNEDIKDKSAQSFAFGILPACNLKSKNKLIFGKSLRPDVQIAKGLFLKMYESLAKLPCPNPEKNPVWVAIGKVHDSRDEIEVFTIDSNKNFKTIRTAIGAGPFEVQSTNSATKNDPNRN